MKSLTIGKLIHQKLILLFAIPVLVLPVNARGDRKNGEKSVFYPVSRIVDGDTSRVDDGSEKGFNHTT